MIRGKAIKLLDSYSEEDGPLFFGRESEKHQILSLVESCPFVVLCGESGTGKTSLLKAGICTALPASGVIYHRTSPSSQHQLLDALSRQTHIDTTGRELPDVLEEIRNFLYAEQRSLLVILDQFEELLVSYRESPSWFTAGLLEPLAKQKNLTLLFSLRSDYLPLFMSWLKPARLMFTAEQFFYLQRLSADQAVDIFQHIMNYEGISVDYQICTDLSGQLASLEIDKTVYPPHIQIVSHYLLNRTSSRKQESFVASPLDLDVPQILSAYFDNEIFAGMESADIIKSLLDILVGREGLRRKLTLEDIAHRVSLDQEELQSYINRLIANRIIRRTEENRYELIHDFLSRHFFESFSLQEKKKRKIQDMLATALLDYRDAHALLDQRRIRLFLHYHEQLNRDEEVMNLLGESLLALCFIGENPYTDIFMFPVFLNMFRTEKDSDAKQQIVSRLKELAGFKDSQVFQMLYKEENDPRVKCKLLEILCEIDYEWTQQEIDVLSGDWKKLHPFLLEEVVVCMKNILRDSYTDFLLSLLKNDAPENARILAIETFRSNSDIVRLLDIIESGYVQKGRVLESCISAIDILLEELPDEPEWELLNKRFCTYLKKMLEGNVTSYSHTCISICIRILSLSAEEKRKLLNVSYEEAWEETVITAIAAKREAADIPFFLDILEIHDRPALLPAIIRSLAYCSDERLIHRIAALYSEQQDIYIKNDILFSLIETGYRESLHLCRSILNDYKQSDKQLIQTAMKGITLFGDQTDAMNLETCFYKEEDLFVKEICLHSLYGMSAFFKDTVTRILLNIWNNGILQENLRMLLACKLLCLEQYEGTDFLTRYLSRTDEYESAKNNTIIYIPVNDPVVEIFKTCLLIPLRFPGYETFRLSIKEFILKSANRLQAGVALVVYASRFADPSTDPQWFKELLYTAARPEIAALATLALVMNPVPDTLKSLSEQVVTAHWPLVRRLSLYALAMPELEGEEHEKRLRAILLPLKCDGSNKLAELGIKLFATCARKEDCGLLLEYTDNRSLPESLLFLIRRVVRQMDKPLSERRLPPLENFFSGNNAYWRDSLKLFAFWSFI